MKRMILVASFIGVFTSFATDYWWGKGADGSYSGAIDAGDHWHAGSATGASGIVPNVGDRMFLGRDVYSNYTVTIPDGVYTNFARLTASVYAAHSLTVDCSRTVFRHPKNTEGVYNAEPLAFYYNDYVSSIFGLNLSNATSPDATATTAPHFEISNTVIRATSPATKRMRLEFDGGGANFHNVLGHAWTSTIYPRLYVFIYNNNGANAGAPKTDFSEVVFTNGCSLAAPNLCLQGNSWTNIFRLNGGTHSCSACQIPARYDGQAISEYPTLTDLIVENDAVFSIGGTLNLGQNANATNRINRLIARDGGVMTVTGVEGKYGHHQLIADGGTIELGLGNQNLRPNDQMTLDIQVSNGGKLVMNQQGSGRGAYIGYVSDKELVTMGVTNATYETRKGGKAVFYNGRVGFKDSLIDSADTLRFGGGTKPVEVTIVDCVVSNRGAFCIGGDGACNLAISGTRYYGDFYLGQNSTGAASFAYTGRVEAVGTDFNLESGKLYIGYQPKVTGVFNLRSGSVVSESGVGVSIGYCGSGEMNVFGGSVRAYQASVAGSGVTETDVGEESVLRILGGEFCIGAQNQGDFIGMAVADSSLKTRRGRLVLNGGVLESCATFGGICAACREGSGYAAFEADGGTLRAPCDSTRLFHHFDEAKVGRKGLVIDNAGHVVTVAQMIVDKTDAAGAGCVTLAGEGTTRLTGDLGGLGILVANEGTVDLSALGGNELGSLVATNTAALKLDPAKTIVLSGVLELAHIELKLSSVAEKGVYDLFTYGTSVSAETRTALEDAIVTEGVSEGLAAEFAEEEVDGAFVLRMTVRDAVNTVISVSSGSEVHAADISCLPMDSVTASVANGADLTISGKVGKGRFIKDGEGSLVLSNPDNCFLPGFLLLNGRITVSDPATLGGGKVALKNGVLRIAGPVADADYGYGFTFAQESTTDHVIIDAAVDVRMGIPKSVNHTGGLTKRGAGRLTFTVEDVESSVGGDGTHDHSTGFWSERQSLVYPQIFDEATGLMTNGTFGAFNVNEGELRVVGKGEDAKVTTTGDLCIALPSTGGSAQPGLVLDGVTWQNASKPVFVASCIDYSTPVVADFADEPYLILTNGAKLVAGSMYVNRLNNDTKAFAKFAVNDSSIELTSTLYANRAQTDRAQAQWKFRNSRLQASISLFRDFTMDFDNSVWAKDANDTPASLSREVTTVASAICTLSFRNGSKMCCKTITMSDREPPHPLTIKFEDSEWIPAVDADYVFDWADRSSWISVVATGRGLKLPVPASRTWTVNQPVTGDGALVNSGAGTLVLGEGVVQYDGATRCESGIVDLGGTVQAVRMAGAGRFLNGTVAAGGGIVIEVDDEYRTLAAPVLSGISFAGSFRVDLGRTAENPLAEPFRPITVCTYEGADPNVSGWRLKGTGISNVRGVFAAKDGVVTVTPERVGIVMIVR